MHYIERNIIYIT